MNNLTKRPAIVILGAAVAPDGSPSPSLLRRTRHGADLFHAGHGAFIIACGGLGRFPPTEADVMEGILLQADVPGDAITTEASSTNTYENLRNAKALLAQHGSLQMVIVTDPMHAPRARLLAWALGISATIDTPSLAGMPWKTRLRRFRHEALSLPLHLVALPYWLWRDRQR